MIPFWRNVRYTDDGCTVYQCLSCYEEWEARSEPGWIDCYDRSNYPSYGAQRYSSSKNGGRVFWWSTKRTRPIYRPYMRYCPYCGIKWEGPVRCEPDNERMLGPRRLKIYNFDHASRMYRGLDSPRWYWVLQKREIWPDREKPEPWASRRKINPRRHGSLKVWKYLQDEKKLCVVEDKHSERFFNVKHVVRIVVRDANHLVEQLPEVYHLRY